MQTSISFMTDTSPASHRDAVKSKLSAAYHEWAWAISVEILAAMGRRRNWPKEDESGMGGENTLLVTYLNRT